MKHRLSSSVAQPLSLLLLLTAGCWSSAEVPGDGSVTSNTTGAAGEPFVGPVPYDPEGPLGWASVPGLGLDGTVGGEGADEVVVSDYNNFAAMVGSAEPAIVRVSGEISGLEISVHSNKTIIGEPGAVVRASLRLSRVQNVIIRNLTVVGENCVGASQCSEGHDAITVRESHHIWFDHLDVSDGSDGNLDITQGSDYVTVSNSKFWYSGTTRNHRFSNLVGGADNNPIDEGKLRVTFFRNWWADNVEQRMPRTRYGDIHVLNNLYTSATSDYCISAGFQATVLVEGNVFLGVKDPHEVTSGQMLARGNYYDDDVEGEQGDTGVGFEPPYEYPVESSDGLEASIRETAGPR